MKHLTINSVLACVLASSLCAQDAVVSYNASDLALGDASSLTWSPTGSSAVGAMSTSLSGGDVVAVEGYNGFDQAISNGVFGNDVSGFNAFNGSDFTIELWVSTSDLAGRHALVELGGATDGTSLILEGADLFFTVEDNGVSNSASYTFTSTPSDFIQIVGVTDTVNDRLDLYVDGASVGSMVSTTFVDTIGGNFGSFSGTDTNVARPDGSSGVFTSFDGSIALANFYDSALSEIEVMAKYNAVAVPEPGHIGMLLAGLALGAVIIRRLRQ